jgi:hydroxyacylglutathione hydrolase
MAGPGPRVALIRHHQRTRPCKFVAAVTEGQPAPPQYFEFDARRNREFRPLLDAAAPALLQIAEVLARRDAGAVLLDAREPAAFAAGHLCGAVNVGLQGRFAEWAGAVLAPDRDVVLVGDPAIAAEAKLRLGRVGYDTVAGQLDDLASVFTARPDLIEASSRLTIEQLAELRGLEPALQLVDVRSPSETAEGTLPGAREIPLAILTRSLAGLDRSAPVLVYCASGYRSQVAASVLQAAGFADVSDLLGGYGAWEGTGLPVALAGKPGVPARSRGSAGRHRRAGTRNAASRARNGIVVSTSPNLPSSVDCDWLSADGSFVPFRVALTGGC